MVEVGAVMHDSESDQETVFEIVFILSSLDRKQILEDIYLYSGRSSLI